MAQKSEKAPSLKPPKEWWDKTYAGVKKGNPKLSDEAIRKIVGDMWYNKMKRSGRVAARKAEGKTYGKAPVQKGHLPENIGASMANRAANRISDGFINKGHANYGRKTSPGEEALREYRELNKAHVDNDIEKGLKFPKTGKEIKAAIPNKIKKCNEEIGEINECISDLTSVIAGTKDLTAEIIKECSEYTYVFEDYPIPVTNDSSNTVTPGTTQPEDPKKIAARAISSMQRKIKWKQESIDKLNKIVNNIKDGTKYELNEWELDEYGF